MQDRRVTQHGVARSSEEAAEAWAVSLRTPSWMANPRLPGPR
jgi:hypothetical protein